MQVVRNGITRTVILTRHHAIKFPTLRYGWDKFLRGLLSNMSEARFSCLSEQFRLCPVIWSARGGFMNVMPRCEPLGDAQWERIAIDPAREPWEWNGFQCDFKYDNFGVLDGRIVLLDYGELT